MIANANALSKDERCITPGCKDRRHSRGLCEACRRSAYRLVNKGLATEEQLVQLGLMLDKESGRPAGLFYAEFLRRSEKATAKVVKHKK